MKNYSNTEAYTPFDHFFLKALRSVSHVVSVRKLTQPFWGRWRASDIGDDVLFDFLSSIRNLDDWPDAAMAMLERESKLFEQRRGRLDADETVRELRRLSYLCNLGQWGILPINDQKTSIYRASRDYCFEAETLAFGDRFRRFEVEWNGHAFPANLHLPPPQARPASLIVVVHGLDDCKEEHLATELALLDAGFAVIGFDGPGQGEAFLLERMLWTPAFPGIVPALIDAVSDDPAIDSDRVGSVGFSIGSTWSLVAASRDPRIRAVYDLGAPINTRAFARVPFLIKSKMCQITGAKTQDEIAAVLAQNYADTPEILDNIHAAVRIAHGLKDRVVSTDDKLWLKGELEKPGRATDVTMVTFEDGDHCCTNHVPEIRADMCRHFQLHLAET
ncbi:MAG: prolyl oligopeptidase family serine peptidase [Salaquimonas sp.]|nr:prolyl oligopeptidase family serine peptidase [Salaquimonas sp.]